jgi:hypothetical protein
MFGFGGLGKMLILLGVFIILVGLLLLVGEKIPWIGRLPGDIIIRKKNFTFYFPYHHLHSHQHHPDVTVLDIQKINPKYLLGLS